MRPYFRYGALICFWHADPQARVACETLATTNEVVIAGEVRGPASVTFEKIEQGTREAIRDIGYEQEGFHWRNADIRIRLHAQSQDIAVGVDAAGNKDEGAGDQGIMFGFACRETPAFMPAPLYYAHDILKRLADARHSGATKNLGPDAKSQVTLRYVDGKPVGTTSVVVSTQHNADASQEEIRETVRAHVTKSLPKGWMCEESQFYVNPTGRFVIGGPDGDCGLTGRKIIVETYGGAAPHEWRCVFRQRSHQGRPLGRPMPRAIWPKNVVAAGLADRCTIQLSLCHRCRPPLVDLRRYGGHGPGGRGKAGPSARSGHGPDAARAFALTFSSTGRSMPVRRPTATLVAHPNLTADSRGKRSTWSTPCDPPSPNR